MDLAQEHYKHAKLHVIAFDFSKKAVQLVQQAGRKNVTAFVWDICKSPLSPALQALPPPLSPPPIVTSVQREQQHMEEQELRTFMGSDILVNTLKHLSHNHAWNIVDLVTCIFVISAMTPQSIPLLVKRLYLCMRPGAICFVRDYSVHDLAHFRFQHEKDGYKKLNDNFYVRGDGTQVLFLRTEELISWFTMDNMFTVLQCEYCHRTLTNTRQQLNMDRVFVQARFRRV